MSQTWSERFFTLKRDPRDGTIAGLCAALADLVGIDVLLVRTAFVIGAFSAGLGVLGYLIGWALTRDASGRAPLDRISRQWRRWSPRAIGIITLVIVGVAVVVVSAAFPLGTLPLAILIVAVWMSQRVDEDLSGGSAETIRPESRPIPYWLTAMTVACSVAIGVTAGLVADQVGVGIAALLAMVGLWLAVLSRRSTSIVLVGIGILASAALVVTLVIDDAARSYDYVHDPSGSRSVWAGAQTFDFSQAPRGQWSIDAVDSTVTVVVPADRPSHIVLRYLDAAPSDMVEARQLAADPRTPRELTTDYEFNPDPERPRLEITVNLFNSSAYVEEP